MCSEQALVGRSNWTTKDDQYSPSDLAGLPECFNNYGPLNVLHLLGCLTAAGRNNSNILDSVYVPLSTELIASFSEQSQELGYMDAAGDANGVATLAKGATMYVRGWAVDTTSGAPASNPTKSILVICGQLLSCAALRRWVHLFAA